MTTRKSKASAPRHVEVQMGNVAYRGDDGIEHSLRLPTHISVDEYERQTIEEQVLARWLAAILRRGHTLGASPAHTVARMLDAYANALPVLRTPKPKKGAAPKFDPGIAALSVAVLMAREGIGYTEASDRVADSIGLEGGDAVRKRIKLHMETAKRMVECAEILASTEKKGQ